MSHNLYLLRVGVCGETVRCLGIDQPLFKRGDDVVLQTDRGEMIAEVMQQLPDRKISTSTNEEEAQQSQILRPTSEYDLQQQRELKQRAEQDFFLWNQRIQEWQVEVELIDLEWTLDGEKLILYVLNSRGPECTKLAIQAEAEGLGVIDVVPVSATGIEAPVKSGCGCGSGGCSK